MARIRTIKPEFWTDEALTECSLNARLLFIGTWNFADDKGNFQHSWKQLKMKIFPADDVKVLSLLNELIAHGLLIEYSVNGQKFLHIRTFSKHQVINRPSSSNIPPYDDSLRTHGVIMENEQPKFTEGSLREGKGREGNRKGREGKHTKTAPPENWKPSEKTAQAMAKEFNLPEGALEQYVEGFLDLCSANGYTYADHDAAFRNCVRKDWPGLRINGSVKPKARSLVEIMEAEDRANSAHLALPADPDDDIPF